MERLWAAAVVVAVSVIGTLMLTDYRAGRMAAVRHVCSVEIVPGIDQCPPDDARWVIGIWPDGNMLMLRFEGGAWHLDTSLVDGRLRVWPPRWVEVKQVIVHE